MQIHQLRVLLKSRFLTHFCRGTWHSEFLTIPVDAAAHPIPGTTLNTARFYISPFQDHTFSPWKSCPALSPIYQSPLKEPTFNPCFFPSFLYHSLACSPSPLLKLFRHMTLKGLSAIISGTFWPYLILGPPGMWATAPLHWKMILWPPLSHTCYVSWLNSQISHAPSPEPRSGLPPVCGTSLFQCQCTSNLVLLFSH